LISFVGTHSRHLHLQQEHPWHLPLRNMIIAFKTIKSASVTVITHQPFRTKKSCSATAISFLY